VAEAIVSGPGDGEWLERDDRVLLVKVDLPQFSATEISFDPSFRVDQHTHDDHVDSFYVLEGEVEFLLADGPRRVGPGTLVSVPPGVVHGFANPGPGRARLLNFHAPDAGFAASLPRS
jgi:quercetin dioxygenase-like cupin family protein